MRNTHKKKKSAPRPRAKHSPVPARPPATASPGHLPGFDDARASRPLAADGFATALEISRLLDDPALDDPALRRLCDSSLTSARDPARGTTWLPNPIGSRWPVAADATGRSPTLAGLHARATHKATARSGLPEHFNSATDFERATGWGSATIDYAIKQGATDIREASSRIRLTPLMNFWGKKLNLWLNKDGTTNLEETERGGFNLEQEKAGLAREQKIAEARDNALAEQRLHDRAAVEKSVQIEFLAPLREVLLALQKKKNRYGGTPEICREIIEHDFPKCLAQLGAGRPDLAHATAHAEPDQPADFVI